MALSPPHNDSDVMLSPCRALPGTPGSTPPTSTLSIFTAILQSILLCHSSICCTPAPPAPDPAAQAAWPPGSSCPDCGWASDAPAPPCLQHCPPSLAAPALVQRKAAGDTAASSLPSAVRPRPTTALPRTRPRRTPGECMQVQLWRCQHDHSSSVQGGLHAGMAMHTESSCMRGCACRR